MKHNVRQSDTEGGCDEKRTTGPRVSALIGSRRIRGAGSTTKKGLFVGMASKKKKALKKGKQINRRKALVWTVAAGALGFLTKILIVLR